MKTKFQKAMGNIAYMERCQAMVAPPGQSRKPKKEKGKKHNCTRPVDRDDAGRASGTLGKREARLQARLRDHATTCNSHKDNGKGYRKPGSMTK